VGLGPGKVGAVVEGTGLRVLAWAVVPTHVHLLVGAGKAPPATAMRRLPAGYAVAFNHPHRRHGHLLQYR
jgi:hypothetical protein